MNLHEILVRLREGQKVICPLCNKGMLKPVNNSDYKTTHGFKCSCCEKMMNID